MTPTPFWVLALLYWLHLLATVLWIGGLAALALLVLPAAAQALDRRAYAALLDSIQRRLDPLGWFCLLLLAATGMFQMSASPYYAGLLSITNRWALAILLKHLLFGGMALLSAFLTWGLLPALRRAAFRQAQGLDAPQLEKLQRQNLWLLRLNLALALLVLLLTAFARAA